MRLRNRNERGSGRPNTRSRRPELAAVLWAVLFVVTLLWTFPALGVLPPMFAEPPLRLLHWLALALLMAVVAGVIVVALDEAWLTLRRWRIRRRRADVGTVEIPPARGRRP